MKNLYRIKLELTSDQKKVFEDVLVQWEDTVQAYKHLRKKYSGVKRNIKSIEKRLVKMMDRLPENTSTPRWVMNEIACIENKYTAIDKAIKNYRQAMQSFNRIAGLPHFRTFNPNQHQDWFIGNLKNSLRNAHMEIARGLDAIRITDRYFRNITTAFKMHAKHQKMLNSYRQRQPPVPAEQDVLNS